MKRVMFVLSLFSSCIYVHMQGMDTDMVNEDDINLVFGSGQDIQVPLSYLNGTKFANTSATNVIVNLNADVNTVFEVLYLAAESADPYNEIINCIKEHSVAQLTALAASSVPLTDDLFDLLQMAHAFDMPLLKDAVARTIVESLDDTHTIFCYTAFAHPGYDPSILVEQLTSLNPAVADLSCRLVKEFFLVHHEIIQNPYGYNFTVSFDELRHNSFKFAESNEDGSLHLNLYAMALGSLEGLQDLAEKANVLTIDLSHNFLTGIDPNIFDGFDSLEQVNISQNPQLSTENIAQLQQAWPAIEFTTD